MWSNYMGRSETNANSLSEMSNMATMGKSRSDQNSLVQAVFAHYT